MSPLTEPTKLVLKKDSVAATDVNIREVSLLLHGNGTNGSTTIVDSSLNPKTVTAFGNAQISTGQSKFGGSSIAFDGNGDYLTIASNAEFNFGTNDFTIEFWLYLSSIGSPRIICDFRSSNAIQLAPTIYTSATNLAYFNNGADRIIGAQLSTSTWHHVALARSGTSTRLFLNGVQTGSTYTDSSDYPQRPLAVGGFPYIGGFDSHGYIDELRITKGVARYTSNFTPPTAPFPDF